jgi:membrane-associated phospholipid phosphatase
VKKPVHPSMPDAHHAPRLAVSVGLCALILTAIAVWQTGSDTALFLSINQAAFRYLPAALPDTLTLLGHGLVAVMLLSPFLATQPQVMMAGLLATIPAAAFSRAFKLLAHRPRPAAVLPSDIIHVHGEWLAGHNSFPSGHSITVFLVLGVILLTCRGLRQHRVATAALITLASMAACSRIMVGAHWPTDALAGSALGLMAATLGAWAMHARPSLFPRVGGRIHRVLCAVVAGCALYLPLVDTGYPAALAAQTAFAVLGLAFAWRGWRSAAGHPATPNVGPTNHA